MKKTLLFAALLASSIGFSQTNLVLNGSVDEHTSSTSDNSDAWDMTPNSTIEDESGTVIDSPYRALWNNSDLDQYLRDTYNGGDNLDEQPGSSSNGTYDGETKTRSVKLYDDGSPAITGSSRRLYQKVAVTAGVSYTFSVDSRSESENNPSDVFMLNEEITTEVGLENGASDSRVDAYMEITNDFNSSSGSSTENTFTNNSLTFTASGDFVVIYIRALGADSEETEVYYDNLSLVEAATASVKDVLASKFDLFPNPAKETLKIQAADVELTSIQIYSVLGKQVYVSNTEMSSIDVSNFAKGMYLLKLNTASGSATKKIIVE